MSGFPRSPNALKGAFLVYDGESQDPKKIVFQYNPDSLIRRIHPQVTQISQTQGAASFSLNGPPIETITFDLEFDASDKLEREDALAVNLGIYPQLASLELILYPRAGASEEPLTVFVWGEKRILPVLLTECSIVEEAFDPKLNPTRAKVTLVLRVLTSADFGPSHRGYKMFLEHMTIMEQLAALPVL